MYKATIKKSNRGEISKKEQIRLTRQLECESIDDVVTADEHLMINEGFEYYIMDVHNDKLENPDYASCVIHDTSTDTYYRTSSTSLMEELQVLCEELEGESFALDIFKKESKNYKGKYFISCTVA